MDDDTIVFTEADRLELLTMLDHTCEPKWWPHRMGETWTCDECGHRYVTDIAQNMGGVSAKAIALGLLDPLTLGWRTVGTETPV